MSETMFRKKALKKLSSPEQLDELIKVTTAREWLALLALCAIVVTIVIWGIFGRIPTMVMGPAVILRTGGVIDIPTQGQGPVTIAGNTKVGSVIKAGQVIATISQVELSTQIEVDRVRLDQLQNEHNETVDHCETLRKNKASSFDLQRKDLDVLIKQQNDLVQKIRENLEAVTALYKDRTVSDLELIKAKKDLVNSESTLLGFQEKLANISVLESEAYHDLEQLRFQSSQAVNELNTEIKVQELRLKTMSQVISPYTGRVLEVMANNGTVVDIGTPLVSLEQTDKAMEVMIFISDTVGEKVDPGMKVELTPSTVNREKFGYIIGKVNYVSEFPVTEREMSKLLDNPSLVEQLAANGVPVQVNADLTLDSKTPSGYMWSSGRGPMLKISSGTLCSASIVVSEQPPITLVVPFLKKFFGLS
ncbi:MAG: NHLP bacteriocin system secretion protein [bacterium]|nr:NHLP bacteriocin system secretion protein [bacterium]